jgi:transcriptional regulator with XRE-family HTH domain
MLSLKSVPEIASELALRIRARRLQRAWTQAETARRSGLKEATYVRFERTGKISLLRLLKVLDLLGLLDEFDRIGRERDYTGLKLEDVVKPERKRGSRKHA